MRHMFYWISNSALVRRSGKTRSRHTRSCCLLFSFQFQNKIRWSRKLNVCYRAQCKKFVYAKRKETNNFPVNTISRRKNYFVSHWSQFGDQSNLKLHASLRDTRIKLRVKFYDLSSSHPSRWWFSRKKNILERWDTRWTITSLDDERWCQWFVKNDRLLLWRYHKCSYDSLACNFDLKIWRVGTLHGEIF